MMRLFTLILCVASTAAYAETNSRGSSVASLTNSIRGQLVALNRTTIAAEITGKIISFPIGKGMKLQRGDQIARFDCRVDEANLKMAKAREEAANSQLLVNERLQQLKNISSLELRLSQSQEHIAKAERERSEAIVAKCEIVAPFSGIVTDKFVNTHQSVSQGEPLLELTDTSHLEIEMVAPSTSLLSYQQDVPFTLRIDETGFEVSARVDRIVGSIDPVSQTILIIGTLIDNPGGLMPGMSGTVNFSDP